METYRHIVVFELFLSILRSVTLAMTINEILHSVPLWHESISVSRTHLVASILHVEEGSSLSTNRCVLHQRTGILTQKLSGDWN